MQELSKQDLAKAESGGFPIVALILLVVFGSLAAAALPLALGFVSVIVTGALIYFISLEMSTSVFVTNMASMIGIGVAIDYSLFILARYREERRAGREPDEARTQALATSGLAVTFSGLAVIVSLAGLWMVDNQALRSMALGAMTVVAVSILTATTLLPVLIAMLGDRVMPGGVVAGCCAHRRPFRAPGSSAAPGRGSGDPSISDSSAPDGSGGDGATGSFWERWSHAVMARPWTAGDRSQRHPAHAGDPAALGRDRHRGRSPSSRRAATCGSATNWPRSRSAAAPTRCRSSPTSTRAGPRPRPPPSSASWRATPGVASVAPPVYAAESVLFQATPSAPSESDAAVALVERLRDTVVPASALSQVATVDVGGETARSEDTRTQISGSMWKIVLFVLALSYLVLMVMLRSLLLPLKAVLMNLLSIGAAFGVLVAIFQWGWFDSLLGFESQGALDTINVPLIFAIVFGLSMDYEVFLMSRIRERYLVHGDNERAVAEGPLLERPHDLLGGADHDLPSSPSSSSPACPRSRSWASAARWRSPSTRPWCG